MPTEQITFATQIDDWSVEAYYQFSSEAINIDPKGSFLEAILQQKVEQAYLQVAHIQWKATSDTILIVHMHIMK